jgi:hypothetical protein
MLPLASQQAQKDITQEGETILPKRKADPRKPAWILAPRPGLEPGTCGLTPISRHGVKTANRSLVVLATIVSISLPLHRPARTRFFVVLAANRIAPNTHQVQALCRPRTRPGGLATPEEHWYRVSSKSLLTVRWLPIAWHQSRIGSRRRRPGFDKQGRRSSVHSVWVVHVQLIRWLAASAWILAQAKQRFTSKGFCSLSMW